MQDSARKPCLSVSTGGRPGPGGPGRARRSPRHPWGSPPEQLVEQVAGPLVLLDLCGKVVLVLRPECVLPGNLVRRGAPGGKVLPPFLQLVGFLDHVPLVLLAIAVVNLLEL